MVLCGEDYDLSQRTTEKLSDFCGRLFSCKSPLIGSGGNGVRSGGGHLKCMGARAGSAIPPAACPLLCRPLPKQHCSQHLWFSPPFATELKQVVSLGVFF